MPANLFDLAEKQQLEAMNRQSKYDLSVLPVTIKEEQSANLSPRCIVQNYLYADVSLLVAAGHTGKTTMALYEMIHIALGWPVWGLEIKAPGKCLFVTAEDSRETCVARLREIKSTLNLAPEQDAIVREKVLIMDVSGLGIKLVKTDKDIVLTGLSEAIVDQFKDSRLSLLTFDPLVSFGASEQAVNDNAQALVTAARRLVKGLNCCVRYIHHTGQTAAREKIRDQYASRSGTALPDGARMVTNLNKWEPGMSPLPKGISQGKEIVLMTRAKLSFVEKQPDIFIERDGWSFDYFYLPPPRPESEIVAELKDQLVRFLDSKLSQGIYLTKTQIEQAHIDEIAMKRNDFRKTIEQLLVEQRVINEDLPEELRQGSKKTYLKPISPFSKHGRAG